MSYRLLVGEIWPDEPQKREQDDPHTWNVLCYQDLTEDQHLLNRLLL